MKYLLFTMVLALGLNSAFAAKPAKKVSHDKEHHHTGTPDHDHDDAHHKDHDHKAHHPDHDANKAVGEDEHAPAAKKP